MGTLAKSVLLPGKPGDGVGFVQFEPGDEVPQWAAKQMGAHLFEDEQHPFPDSKYPGKSDDDEPKGSGDREPGSVAPKSGAGSSRDAWASYANDVEVDIPSGMGRDEIISAIEAAGKPTEPDAQ